MRCVSRVKSRETASFISENAKEQKIKNEQKIKKQEMPLLREYLSGDEA